MFKYAQRRAALGQGEKVFFCRLLGSPHPCIGWFLGGRSRRNRSPADLTAPPTDTLGNGSAAMNTYPTLILLAALLAASPTVTAAALDDIKLDVSHDLCEGAGAN
jgi:hypothetical protein